MVSGSCHPLGASTLLEAIIPLLTDTPHPLQHERSMAPPANELVRLSLPDGWLTGDVWLSGRPDQPVVLFIHGFGSVRRGEKALALQAACARRGWSFAAFDFRAHGESSGTMLDLRPSALLADLDAVRAWLAGRGMTRILPVGSSMGGWAAAWFTLLHPETVPACVLLAPALSWLTSRWSKLNEAERSLWQQTGRYKVKTTWVETEIGYGIVEEMDRYPHARLLAEWSRPLLIFHGMKDDVISYAQSVSFAEQAQHPGIALHLFKDGDHRLTAHKDVIAEGACAFFEIHGLSMT